MGYIQKSTYFRCLNQLTEAMEESQSSATVDFVPNQEIQCVLEKEGSLPCSKKSPHVPTLSPTIPIHTPKFHVFKIPFNIILPSTPRSWK